ASRYVDLLRRLLTPEQEELLRLAAGMGYYDTPKGSTLEEIAKRVGLSVSPVHKRLKNIEELLVSAHVEGTSAIAAPRRRRHRAHVTLPTAVPCEIALRVRWPASRISKFVASVPGSRALVQNLVLEPGFTTFLLVVLAPESEYLRLVNDFTSRPDVQNVE